MRRRKTEQSLGLSVGTLERTPGTAYGAELLRTFRYKRSGFIGAELPGKVMLDHPDSLRYKGHSAK